MNTTAMLDLVVTREKGATGAVGIGHDVQARRRHGQVVHELVDLLAEAIVRDVLERRRAAEAGVPTGNEPSEPEAGTAPAIGRPMGADPMNAGHLR